MKKALILIDMQKAFFGSEPLKNLQRELVENCNSLVASAKRNGALIITLRTLHSRDRQTWTLNMLDDDQGFLFDEDGDAQYVDGLDTEYSHEIIKTRDSGFWQTELESILRENDIDSLVLGGVSTHLCILQTASDAYNANFRVELAIEAIASDNPDMHQSTLDFLHQEYRMKRVKNNQISWS